MLLMGERERREGEFADLIHELIFVVSKIEWVRRLSLHNFVSFCILIYVSSPLVFSLHLSIYLSIFLTLAPPVTLSFSLFFFYYFSVPLSFTHTHTHTRQETLRTSSIKTPTGMNKNPRLWCRLMRSFCPLRWQ